ncbi:hypothetical protein FRB98_008270 [Tulasnella sp. 332]|nr:hypothetical protein FRB98_008270 [Tulasnella sp. 332]
MPDIDDLGTAAGGSETPTLSPSQRDTEQRMLLLKTPVKRSALPRKQLAIVSLCCLAEPIAFTQIFPYINAMVEELGVAENPTDVGFYSGIVDSLFFVMQLLTIFQWSRLSDRIGRRPVIVFGLSGVALASLCFGLSTSFWQILASRAMAGGLSGNIAVIQSLISEITDETNQVQAFALIGVMWNIGTVIGPFLGGYLSHPSERYPAVFGQFEFLKRHPFFLPCFASFFITICCAIGSAFLLNKVPENHPPSAIDGQADTLCQSTSYGATTTNLLRRTSPDIVETALPSAIELLSIRQVQLVLIVGFFLSFEGVSWETVFILFAYTPVSAGGLEQNPAQIGALLSVTGLLGGLAALFVFPTLQHRFGTMPVYRTCMALWIAVFMLFPTASLLARWTFLDKDHDRLALGLVWTNVALILGTGRLASMAFLARMITVKAAAPNQQSLGAIFGLAQTMVCIARGVGPAFVSSYRSPTCDNLRSMRGGVSVDVLRAVDVLLASAGLSSDGWVMQSMIGEITDETNQAQAFALGGVLWNTLPSKIAQSHPVRVVDGNPAMRPRPKNYGATDPARLQTMPTATGPAPPSVIELLSIRQVQLVITVGFFLAFECVAWETVFILFAYTSISIGGLGRNPAQIGTLLSVTGFLGIFIALFGFPALQHRFGTRPLYRMCMALWLAIYVLFLSTSLLARWTFSGKDHDPSALGLIWTGVVLILGTGRFASMGFPANMIMVKGAAPNKQSLGATFGLSQSVGCIARAVGPAFVS